MSARITLFLHVIRNIPCPPRPLEGTRGLFGGLVLDLRSWVLMKVLIFCSFSFLFLFCTIILMYFLQQLLAHVKWSAKVLEEVWVLEIQYFLQQVLALVIGSGWKGQSWKVDLVCCLLNWSAAPRRHLQQVLARVISYSVEGDNLGKLILFCCLLNWSAASRSQLENATLGFKRCLLVEQMAAQVFPQLCYWDGW